MFNGGVATIYVSDMDRAVAFYAETLGLRLIGRNENVWATIDAGAGLILGLHAAAGDDPRVGRRGAITVGLTVRRPIDKVVDRLTARGVRFRGPVETDPGGLGRMAFFTDPDGNELYLCEA